MPVTERDYMRDVPEYRRLAGEAPGGAAAKTRPWAWLALGAIGVLAVVALVAPRLPLRQAAPVPIALPGLLPVGPVASGAVRSHPMAGPTTVRVGSIMTATGTVSTGVSGLVVVEAQWGRGSWSRLATVETENGAYRVRYGLFRDGVVHIRILLPNGEDAVSTITVVPKQRDSATVGEDAIRAV
jgi:hypothetical protein